MMPGLLDETMGSQVATNKGKTRKTGFHTTGYQMIQGLQDQTKGPQAATNEIKKWKNKFS